MFYKHFGFTLVELMIVMAIIVILSSVALPAYINEYTARAQVAEGSSLMTGIKQAVEEWIGSQGSFPTTANLTNRSARIAGKYVSSILSTPASQLMTITMKSVNSSVNGSVAGKYFTYAYNRTTGIWTCNIGNIDAKYLPSNCK